MQVPKSLTKPRRNPAGAPGWAIGVATGELYGCRRVKGEREAVVMGEREGGGYGAVNGRQWKMERKGPRKKKGIKKQT